MRTPSDGQDARAQLPAVDRSDADRGGLWRPRPARVHLLLDGILDVCRNAQYEGTKSKSSSSREAPPAVRGGMKWTGDELRRATLAARQNGVDSLPNVR